MAKAPQFKDFRKEDYQEAPGWFGRFLTILNSFSSQVYAALNQALTFGDNIRCQIKEITFSTSATYTSGDWTQITFNSNFSLGTKIIGVLILQIVTDNQLPIVDVNGQTVNWSAENNVIFINYISGLANSSNYIVRLLVI